MVNHLKESHSVINEEALKILVDSSKNLQLSKDSVESKTEEKSPNKQNSGW